MQTPKQKAAKQRQRYYNKEYQRLIEHTKYLYNEMNLGGALGEELPPIEKVLKWAGTKSGLKAPTKKSIKALRRLQTQEQILSGIGNVMPKKGKGREMLETIREEKDEKNKAIKEATKTLNKNKASKKGRKGTSKGKRTHQRETTVDEQIRACDRLLNQLWAEMNSIRNDIIKANKKGNDQRARELQNYFNNGKNIVDRMQDILMSGDEKKIELLEKGAREFFKKYPGGVERSMLYYGAGEIPYYVFKYLDEYTTEIQEESANEVEKPTEDQEAQEVQIEDNTDKWTMNDFEDFPDLF